MLSPHGRRQLADGEPGARLRTRPRSSQTCALEFGVARDVAQVAAKIGEQFPYHRIDLGDGVIIEGQTDPASFVDAYELPTDMSGLTVIDVGTANRVLRPGVCKAWCQGHGRRRDRRVSGA